jgi:sugar phosphate isomerase/epimerase
MQWKDAVKRLEQLPSLDHIEVWLEHLPSTSEIRTIKDMLRGVPLIVHGPFIHTSLVSHIPEIVRVTERRFEEAVDVASKLQARVITFHAGPYPLFEAKNAVLENLATRFAKFSELVDPIATLENMPIKNYGTTREPIGKLSDYEDILRFLPKLRFTLDIGHCLQNGDDFVPFIRRYCERIENIHVHDGVQGGRAHLRFGYGRLDLLSLIDVLVRVGFEKSVSLETISWEDTSSSWETLCRAEVKKGVRRKDCSTDKTVSELPSWLV